MKTAESSIGHALKISAVALSKSVLICLCVLQSSLEGQVSATQPYCTAAQVEGKKQPQAVLPRAAVPKLAIVLMCAGTRGDVQPFIALGLELQVCCTFLKPQS